MPVLNSDNFDDYQDEAVEFAIYPDEYHVTYPTLGLVGEAGEVAEKVKKIIRDKDGSFGPHSEEIAKELGDVLWYVANIADDLGYTLSEIAQMNLEKLRSRKARNVISGSGDNR